MIDRSIVPPRFGAGRVRTAGARRRAQEPGVETDALAKLAASVVAACEKQDEAAARGALADLTAAVEALFGKPGEGNAGASDAVQSEVDRAMGLDPRLHARSVTRSPVTGRVQFSNLGRTR